MKTTEEIEKRIKQMNEFILSDVEKRIREWIDAAEGIDFREKLEQVLKENSQLKARNAELIEALHQAIDQLKSDYMYTPLDGNASLIRKLEACAS